jgi:hypothetical protein
MSDEDWVASMRRRDQYLFDAAAELDRRGARLRVRSSSAADAEKDTA